MTGPFSSCVFVLGNFCRQAEGGKFPFRRTSQRRASPLGPSGRSVAPRCGSTPPGSIQDLGDATESVGWLKTGGAVGEPGGEC